MYRDEVIEEVWRNRDAYAAEHHHDLGEIVADLMRKQGQSGARLSDRKPRRTNKPAGDQGPSVRA